LKEQNTSLEEIRKEGIAFFSEAIKKWGILIHILNEGHKTGYISGNNVVEANKIFVEAHAHKFISNPKVNIPELIF